MSHVFNGKVYIEPSTGARIVSAIPPTAIQLGSANLGIIAESTAGLTAADGKVYEFFSSQSEELKNILVGGVGQQVCSIGFAPSTQYAGAAKITYVRGQAATNATGVITNDTDKTFTMVSSDKGAYLSDATDGLKWKVIAGVVDTNKRILQLQLFSQIIWQSPETTNTYTDMKNAVEADSTVYGEDAIIQSVTLGAGSAATAFTATGSFAVFTGGTTTAMTGTDVDDALDLLRTKEIDVLYLASESSTNHLKAIAHCLVDAETPRICVVGGAVAEDKATVLARAAVLNSHKAVLCYPGVKIPNPTTGVTELQSPMYTAAYVAGLIAGLPPQVPATFKTMAVQGFETNATDGTLVKEEREQLITGGVTFCRFIGGVGYTINKCVTTLLDNSQMINTPSGASREVSIERIKNQLNKELQIGGMQLIVTSGGNVNNLDREDVVNFTSGYLTSRTASPTNDNLILGAEAVTARLVDDAWFVDYGFRPNGPINHMFFTGAIIKNN